MEEVDRHFDCRRRVLGPNAAAASLLIQLAAVWSSFFSHHALRGNSESQARHFRNAFAWKHLEEVLPIQPRVNNGKLPCNLALSRGQAQQDLLSSKQGLAYFFGGLVALATLPNFSFGRLKAGGGSPCLLMGKTGEPAHF